MNVENMSDETREQYEYVHQYIDDEDIAADGEKQGYDLYDDDERADAIRASAWETIDHAIMTHVEKGNDRVAALIRVLPKVPDSMADEVIQSERDYFTNFGTFEDYERELRFEQVAQRYHPRENYNNSERRREIWDELLKFGEYRVTVAGEIEYDDVFDQRDIISQSSTDAHNEGLSLSVQDTPPERYDVDVTVQVLDRPFPDTDPLPDMEDFVFRF